MVHVLKKTPDAAIRGADLYRNIRLNEHWSVKEHGLLLDGMKQFGKNWKKVS